MLRDSPVREPGREGPAGGSGASCRRVPTRDSSPPPRSPAPATFSLTLFRRLSTQTKVQRPAPDEPPSPAAPARLRPGEPEARRRAEAAQASLAAGRPAPRGRGGAEGGPGSFPPLPAAALPPTAARQPPPGPRHAAPRGGRRRQVQGEQGITSARPLGSSASRPLSTRLSLSMPPTSARARAALPHARPDCSSPPQGLPAPACTAPPGATCARQVDEGRRRRRGGCRGM